MSKKRRLIHQKDLLDKEHTLSFSTKNADMNGDVKVTVNGKLRDIKKYMGSIKNLEDKTDEYEAKAKAWDKTQKLLAECTQQDVTGDYVLNTFEFESRMEEIIEEYESCDG